MKDDSTHIQHSIKDLFPQLEDELAESLEQEAARRVFVAGTELMRPGQFIRSSMLVIDGLIKVYRQDDEGNEFFLYYIGPGQACALSMVCAMGRETSQISAIAVKDTEVVMVPVEKMDSWMATYRSWHHFVVRTYRERFDELLKTLDSVAFRNMDERLEFYLKRHKDRLKSNIIPITHQEIAQELNSSREVISRLLKKLAERGKIRLHRYHIEILNL
jgi:CRP/FNR family transcriptional regulator